MTEYLITACGTVFLSVIISFIIPQGRLNSAITFVIRMICIVILVLPLTQLFTDVKGGGELADYDYICAFYSENQSKALDKALEEEFGIEVQCDLTIAHGSEGFYLESVNVGVPTEYYSLSDKIYEYLHEADYINITVYESS